MVLGRSSYNESSASGVPTDRRHELQELAFTVHDATQAARAFRLGYSHYCSVISINTPRSLFQPLRVHCFHAGDNDWTDAMLRKRAVQLLSVSTRAPTFFNSRSPSAAATNCDRKFRPLRLPRRLRLVPASKIGAGPTTASRSQP